MNSLPPTSAGFWVRGGAFWLDYLALFFGYAFIQTSFLVLGLNAHARLASAVSYLIAYFAVCAAYGRSPGKMAAGIEVVGKDGAPIGFGRAALRLLGKIVCVLTAGLGFLFAAFTENQRALDDLIAGTRVVNRDGVSGPRRAAMAALGVFGLASPLLIKVLVRNYLNPFLAPYR